MIDLLVVGLHDEFAERTAAVSVNLEQMEANNALNRAINSGKLVFQGIFSYPGFDITKSQCVNDQFQAVPYILVRRYTYNEILVGKAQTDTRQTV